MKRTIDIGIKNPWDFTEHQTNIRSYLLESSFTIMELDPLKELVSGGRDYKHNACTTTDKYYRFCLFTQSRMK